MINSGGRQDAADFEPLAEEAGEVAGGEQDQRAATERQHQQAVEQEADREAADRTRQSAAQKAERDDHRRQQVGADVEDGDAREEAELQQHRRAGRRGRRGGGSWA